MVLKKILRRLTYPHKKTALNYFIDDPRLVFGIPTTPNKLHVGSFIERALGENIVQALHSFLPQHLLDHLDSESTEGMQLRDIQGYRIMLYLLVRKYKPDVVVETGVARGISSAYVLSAMHENDKGRLYSIDLPAASASIDDEPDRASHRYTLSDGQTHKHYEVGHLVPEYLRDRWTLTLEDAKVALPKLLEELGSIDFFYHDSLHTYDHMKFEFETAWPYIKEGGLLLSDDVLWNNAFHEICKRLRRKPAVYRSFGMIRK